MARTMADRLAQSRAKTFVGRESELADFDALLAGDDPAVMFVHGPAGIGKSTLVGQFAARAATRGAPCVTIDARDIPPRLEALELRLAPLLGSDVPDGRTVVIIDGYELLDTVDAPLREQLAPRLPERCILVLAGQQPPSVGWRSDQGWAPFLHLQRLDNLSDDACGQYLQARHVPAEQRAGAIAFSHGHPLALTLVSEVIRQKGAVSITDSTNVVNALMGRLLDGFPTPAHRAALESTAVVRSLNESSLAALLDLPDVYDLFSWLRTLPYVQDGASGIFVHDLVRDVVADDLRWRHPDRYAKLHDRARAHYLERLDSTDPSTQAVALMDLIYLHPDLRVFLQAPAASAALRIEPAAPQDGAAIQAMVARHEGSESGELARHWLTTRLETWSIVRGPDQRIEGALCLLPLETMVPADRSDPAVSAALDELTSRPPLRPGETATLFRFWLARDTYQAVSPVQSILATQFARHFLATHGLAVTLIPFADPEAWQGFCSYTDQRRTPAADFTIGTTTYTCFGHDWRVVPPATWLAQLSRQEVGAAPPPPADRPDTRVLVLDETAFAHAVRQALRDYSRTDRLRSNDLLRCRFITTQLKGTGPDSTAVDLLRTELRTAAEALAHSPADQRLHRVLVRAYLNPAASLERAAEVLQLPSSTFRRLLGTAVGRVATQLWDRELGA